ncbi:MAG TPA: ATP-binding protein [Pyrinomonadaceae bacterium]|jgi:PAS domain S-box-containing protein|nr:ATP-binding protein [Pyrinomonadaceae bacterium]
MAANRIPNSQSVSPDETDRPFSANLPLAEDTLERLAGAFHWTSIDSQSSFSIADPATRTVTPELNLEARYRTLVEQIPAVVFMAYLDRGIGEAYVSPHIEALLGFTQEEWLNDPVRWFKQIHPDDKERWSIEAAGIFLSNEPLRSAYRVIARDGSVVWFHCEAKMVHHADGRPWFIHGTAIDVTDLKEKEAELRSARDELEVRVQERTAELALANRELQIEIAERKRAAQERTELLKREQTARQEAESANRLKDEFLATISHELRTPLTAVLGWACVLRMGTFGESAFEKALEAIERNARSQSQLIDDLLDVSRIVAGKLRLKTQTVDIISVIESALETIQPAAEAKEILITKTLDQLGGTVSGDPDRLQQIVWNLLSNAVKFTARGGRVKISLSARDADALIVVDDSGPGIGADFLPHVFDRFRQADGSYTRTHGGLGLGLAISRHLAELHGGTISARNHDDEPGARFTIELPLVRQPGLPGHSQIADPTMRKPLTPNDLPLSGVTILVVDDDPDALELLTLVFDQYGAEVTPAKSAPEALSAYRQRSVDVIVSDIQMPDVDGYQLLGQLKALAQERAVSLTALAVTAHAKPEDRAMAIKAGFHAHVSKPVDPNELVRILVGLISSNNGH